MRVVPLELHLPDGVAQLVPGSFEQGRPRYGRDGIVLDVDVTIPDDLSPSWFWQGSFLRLRTEPEECGVAIYTGTFGVPGVFDNARELDRLHAELDAAPKKVVSVKKQPLVLPDLSIEPIPEPELIYEQAVF